MRLAWKAKYLAKIVSVFAELNDVLFEYIDVFRVS